jgi:hypothetical protein
MIPENLSFSHLRHLRFIKKVCLTDQIGVLGKRLMFESLIGILVDFSCLRLILRLFK